MKVSSNVNSRRIDVLSGDPATKENAIRARNIAFGSGKARVVFNTNYPMPAQCEEDEIYFNVR